MLVFIFLYVTNGVINIPGQIYLALFRKTPPQISTSFIQSAIFSKNSPYAVLIIDDAISILNTDEDIIVPVTKKTGMEGRANYSLSSYPFSLDGRKVIFPIVAWDKPTVSVTGDQFYYYTDLWIYDFDSKKSLKITNGSKNLLLNNYNSSEYGWVNDHQIAYNCDLMMRKPLKYCIYDQNSGLTNTFTGSYVNKSPTTNAQPIEFRGYSGKDNCFYNFTKSKCAFSRVRFPIYDSMLFEEIWLTQSGRDSLLYRDSPRVDKLYWSSNDRLYGSSISKGIFRLH